MTTPVTVVTGFVGSGKTTLLRHALRSPSMSRALVIVNEVGDAPVDHLLLRDAGDVTVRAFGGTCGALRSDIVRMLLSAATRPRRLRFSHVFVETAGMADPTRLVATIAGHPVLADHFHLDAVVAAVDVTRGLNPLARHPAAVRQIALADALVFTKADLADPGSAAMVRDAALGLSGHATTLVAEPHDWWSRVLGTRSSAAGRLVWEARTRRGGDSSRSDQRLASFSVSLGRAVDDSAFSIWHSVVTQFHREALLRVKGVLRVADQSGPTVVQSVGHVVHAPYTIPRWPTDDHVSRVTVVVDGMHGALREALEAGLRQVLSGARGAARTVDDPSLVRSRR